MRKIKAKLNSKNGATLVMALFYMMFCIAIGSMILSSGSTAMGQVQHLRGEEQSYLNVLSAAELIKDEMKEASFVEETITVTHSACGANEQISPPPTYPNNALTNELQSVYDGSSADETFLIKAELLGLNDVSVTISMREDSALIFVLTEDGSNYTLTLIMPAEINTTNKTDISTHEFEPSPGSGNYTICERIAKTETTTMVFDSGVIYKGAH